MARPRRLAKGTWRLHALRHFFATTLITNNAEPKDVQRALRHKSLQITLENYVHWWPRRERRRGVIGDVLRAADSLGRWPDLCPGCAR